ncbi:MAG TPA: enoyl-CoA hydratase-related protein [Ktedonobacterales bacterium]
MDEFATIQCELAGPVARVTLNRPEARNALGAQMIGELLRCFTALAGPEGDAVRVVVLGAAGRAFCAGGDMRDLGDATQQTAGAKFDELLRAINAAPQVVIGRIQGPAMGGGIGLVCVTDIAIAAQSAAFALPEVRLGLAPALILPYVLQRIGLSETRRLMLTGSRLTPAEARERGLIAQTCADAELDTVVDGVVQEVLQCAPQALRACKQLLFALLNARDTQSTLALREETLNRLRTSDEAAQGISAFLSKQPAPWSPKS